MVTVQVLGVRCPRCDRLYASARQAARESGAPCEVKKVANILQIVEFDPLCLPALAINGKVRASGQVLSPERIKELIHAEVSLAAEAPCS
jgi:small redox-active disulfide protein 2